MQKPPEYGHNLSGQSMNRGRVLEALGLAAVLGLAAWLRLGWPDYYNFGYDEARASLLALQMARSGVFISTGMVSSTGLPNMPGFIWLLSPLFALSSDPLLATCCIAGVNVLAVAGLWRLVRRAWGPLAAFVAALLLASSPWAVFYSRGIWGQDLLIPTAILWMLLLERACRPPSERIRRGRAMNWLRLRAPDIAMAAAVLTAGFAPQVHYAGLALLPATVAAFFMLRLHRRWKGALAGILAAGLSALPFVLALLRDSGLHQAISALLRQAPVSDLAALADLKRLALGQGWEELLLSSDWVWSQPLQRWLGVCRVITAILAVLGLIAMIRLACRRDAVSSRLARLGLALLVVPPLLFIRHSTEVYVQYMLPALPGVFLAVGALAAGDARIRDDVSRRRRVVHQVLSVGTAALVLLTAAGQAAALSQGIRMAGEQALPNGLGTPLGYPRRAARMLQQQTAASGAEVIVYSPGDDPAYIADAAIYEVLLWDSPHRIADGNAVLLLPAAWQARMLAVFPDLPVMAQARADGLVGDEQELPRRAGE
ncbi:MAG: hypothetical protein LLG44_14655, partial [Chloroflexi bacterium]|nr:hypothetical protein [Chloroflexota bacterium]